MSCDSNLTSCSANFPASARSTPQPSTTIFGNLHIPPFRFSGDGLDGRRPVMSRPQQDVIDLTEETSSPPRNPIPTSDIDPGVNRGANRLPRFQRDIIDLDLEDVPQREVQRESSPEIEFLSQRPRLRSHGGAGSTRTSQGPPLRPYRVNHPRTQARPPNRAVPVPHIPRLPQRTHTIRDPTAFPNFVPNHADELIAWEAIRGGGDAFALPAGLDFLTPAFNLENPAARPAVQPRLPTYEAPPSPGAGFTRSPAQEDILVCPNCEDELGLGEDEVKRQVWVVKSCGHVSGVRIDLSARLLTSLQVYCGECTKHRGQAKKKSREPRKTNAFSRCVVEGCSKSVSSSKSIIQIYL